ncbi:MAG: DsrE family protein [Bryocella sp.]
MRPNTLVLACALVFATAFATVAQTPSALAQKPTQTPAQKASNATLPIPGEGTAHDIPGAKETPNPALNYKVIFKLTKGAAKPTDVNEGLQNVASLVNTMAKFGVPASHRHFAVIIYHDATDIILTDAAYKARHDGHSNPNIALMQALTRAGVELKVCGQAVFYKKIDPKTIQPEVELDLAAWTTILNLQTQGYILLGD